MMNASEVMCIGIDVSKDSLELALDDASKTTRFSNDETGVHALYKRIEAAASEARPGMAARRIGAVLLEATGGLERLAAATLCLAGLPVMVINPRQSHEFAKAMGNLAKTDSIDARALSQFARSLNDSAKRDTFLMRMPDPQRDVLHALVIRRRQLIELRVIEDNRWHTSPPIQRRSIEAVRKMLNKEIGKIDDKIDGEMKAHYASKLTLFESCKGIGPNTAACLCAALPELGLVNRQKIAKLVGVAPLHNDSGHHKGKRTTWGGRPEVRSALYMAILSAVRANPVIRPFYERLLAKGKSKKVAMVACMHKLLNILNAIAKSGVPWDDHYSDHLP